MYAFISVYALMYEVYACVDMNPYASMCMCMFAYLCVPACELVTSICGFHCALAHVYICVSEYVCM